MNINANPFAGRVDALSDEEFAFLERAVAARACREKIGLGTFDEAAAEHRPSPPCPSCGETPFRDGKTAAGHQRFRCPNCGERYSSFTGTIFEDSKKDLPTWVDFIELMCWNVPIEGIAEICGLNHKTAYEWRHRVFATVDGYQDGIVLRDRIWIDELWQASHNSSHEKSQVMRSARRFRRWVKSTAPRFFS